MRQQPPRDLLRKRAAHSSHPQAKCLRVRLCFICLHYQACCSLCTAVYCLFPEACYAVEFHCQGRTLNCCGDVLPSRNEMDLPSASRFSLSPGNPRRSIGEHTKPASEHVRTSPTYPLLVKRSKGLLEILRWLSAADALSCWTVPESSHAALRLNPVFSFSLFISQ